jgi:hypothetical protein
VGIGLEYAVIGATLKYFPIENVGVTAGLGAFLGNFGVEVNAPFSIANGWVPYATIRYGVNTRTDLIVRPNIREIRFFSGLIYGIGLKYKPNYEKRRYFTLSANFTPRNKRAIEYIEDFNQEFGTDFVFNAGLFIKPSIGYVVYFK